MELNQHTPQTRGWQSARFCEYPQELGFEIESGETHISQVQLLSHQSKIATKVEVFIGQGDDYHTATFKRLGSLWQWLLALGELLCSSAGRY